MPRWKVIAAKVRGPDHEAQGLPCQDAFNHAVQGCRLIAAIADGAGSARFSERGAQCLVDTVVAALSNRPEPVAGAPEVMLETWRPVVEAAVERARAAVDEIIDEAPTSDPPATPADYHATLVGMVAEPEGGVLFHIGDGAAMAVADTADWLTGTMSPPENGEFANETYFFTQGSWRQHLRLTAFGPSAVIVAVSDGAMPFTVAERFAGLEPRFLAPVTAFLERAAPAAGRKALAGVLDREDARRISGDDKTVLWARLLGDA